MTVNIKGAITAIVTPFDDDDRIDEAAFKTLIEAQIEAGIHGIVPCGTTGESPTLSHEEHCRVVELCVEAVRGRAAVIAGTGSNATHEAVALTRHAAETGADAALVVAPYYNKPSQEGLYRHYKAIAEAASIPIILYNIPGRTGVNILPETMARLARDCKNIVGVKEASGSLTQMQQVRRLCPPEFVLLSGDDALTLPVMAVGGAGVISVVSNLLPQKVVDLVNSSMNNEWEKARSIHSSLLPLIEALFCETNPVPVKTSLAAMGRINERVRPPLCAMSDTNRQRLNTTLKEFGLL